MDGSHPPSDMRYVLVNKEVADLIEDMNTDDYQFLIEVLSLVKCECGCRGRSHIPVTPDDRRLRRLLSTPIREPAVPDLEAQFRV
jgi:hypothetical protein